MSKDAIMIAIDAGNSMDENFSQNASRLKIAMECFKLTLQQKIFNNATHQIGFSLFGDNESDDGNNCQLQPLARPSLDLVRKVVALSQANLGNQKIGGDIFDAIEFVVKRIAAHCQKKKYNKRAFIFTNGRGDTNHTIKGLQKIVNILRDNQIKLNIIALDFMQNYDIQQNTLLENDVLMEGNQEKNAQLLIKLRSMEMQNVQIFPGSLAIELYKKFRKRDVNPVALFKGNFQIGNLSIQVSTYKGIRRQKLKSLQKYDLTQPWNAKIPEGKEIVNDVSYTVEGDETGAVIDKDKQINAYPYGPNYIPVSSMMEAGSKIFEEKNFRLLGFVDKSKIPRHCLMGEADIVVPAENSYARKLFSAFIYSMISLNRYAIARYVPRNNKNGVSPKLVVLMPYRTPQRQLFYLIQLPTAEDIRQYPFNGLKTATQKQKQLVKQLVQKMSLYHNQNGQEVEEVKIQNTFNPVHQYFYQTVFYRAIHNENETPDLDPVIKDYITPEEAKFQQNQELIKNIKKQFKLNKKELASEKAKEKKAVIWKDIVTTDTRPIDTLSMADTQFEDQPMIAGKKFNFEEDDATEHIDPNLPIPSFRRMLTNNHKDLVDVALKEMALHIEQKASVAITKDDIKGLIQCASALRFGCVEQRETIFWDSWLETCSLKIGQQTYRKLIAEGLGFINKSNEEMYKAEELHPVMEEQYDELD